MQHIISKKIQINKEAIFRINNDGTVVVMKMDDDNNFFKITGVAASVWKHLSEKESTFDEIIKQIAEDYEEDVSKINDDAFNFITKLEKLNLVSLH